MSPQHVFLTTLNTLDELEHRLGHLTSTDTYQPSHTELAQFIRHLTEKISQSRDPSSKTMDYTLLHDLQNHLKQIGRQKNTSKTSFSLSQIAYIKLLLSFFNQLEEDPFLLPTAHHTIKHFQLAFALCLLDEPRELIDTWHPLRHFFEQVLKSVRVIELHPCPRSIQLLNFIQTVLFEAILSPQPLRDSFATAQKKFQHYLTQFNQELEQLVQRHINKEQSQSHLMDVRKTVRQVLSETLHNKRLPTFMVDFFNHVWNKYLYMSYLREGIEGKSWQQGIEDMDYLTQSVLIKNPVHLKKDLAQKLDDVMSRIRRHSESIYNGLEADKFFIRLEQVHISILTSTPPESDIQWQQFSAEKDNEEKISCNHTQLKKLKRGDWYRMEIRGMNSHAQLIDINIEHNYLLFSNYSGVLINRMSCNEFATKVHHKHIIRLPLHVAFDHLLQKSLPTLERFIHDTANIIVKQETLRLEKRQQAIESQLQQEAIQHAEQEREKLQHAENNEQQQMLKRILHEVEHLQLGETLEVIDQEKGQFICTLGLKLKSTRKLIFLDRNGRRVAEFLPEQLAQHMLDGLATLIDLDNISQDDLDHLKWNPFSKHGKYS